MATALHDLPFSPRAPWYWGVDAVCGWPCKNNELGHPCPEYIPSHIQGTKDSSMGQLTAAMFEVGGQYRRNM